MKRFLLCSLAFAGLLCGGLSAQVYDNNYPDCTTSSFQLSELFIDAYERGELDSARAIVDRWTSVCGLQEVTNRAVLLIKLRSNDVLEADYISFQYRVMDEYLTRRELITSGNQYAYEYSRPYFGFIPVGKRYDTFTVAAFSAIDNLDDPVFRLLRNVYANVPETGLADINTPELEGSVLRQLYEEELSDVRQLPEGHYSLFAGAWVPLNEDNFVGTHPEIGFEIGAKRQRLSYDFYLGFRFLNAANTYEARRDRGGMPETTDKFFGGFFGLSAGYDLLARGKNEIQFSLGLGADGWDMLEETDNEDATSVFRFVASPGVQYRRYINNSTYLGMYVRYNQVNYRNSGKIDFEVNPLSIGVIYGASTNVTKAERLRQMGQRLNGFR